MKTKIQKISRFVGGVRQSDDHFGLQDRLQKLYKIGMFDFLGEDVTYIEESEIESAFRLFKNKKDETKRTILDYFKQLKFYSNNAFAFLDVHNENLFLQNAIILKEVVQMIEDIRLKNEDEQHQFLGDLFEGFLDQGIKQSEGQESTIFKSEMFADYRKEFESVDKKQRIQKLLKRQVSNLEKIANLQNKRKKKRKRKNS